jgi:ribonuclease BN (tRNA processing enzyme)
MSMPIFKRCFRNEKRADVSNPSSLQKAINMKILPLLFLTAALLSAAAEIEILGSGGPEIDGRASTSYLLWIDGEARLLVDMGSGSMLRFEESGAKLETLEAVVLTHLHIDHSVDLPAFVKAGFFSSRREPLEIIAPYGNDYFPSISEFLEELFGKNGAYRYMGDVLTPQSDSFQIIPFEIKPNAIVTKKYKEFSLKLIAVHHGIVPALALRIEAEGKSIVISGDTNDEDGNLDKIAGNADLFIAHHAIPEHAGKFAKELHMQPSTIARIAEKAHVKKVLLTHRMNRTLHKEQESLKSINGIYEGEVIFAEDRMRVGF